MTTIESVNLSFVNIGICFGTSIEIARDNLPTAYVKQRHKCFCHDSNGKKKNNNCQK